MTATDHSDTTEKRTEHTDPVALELPDGWALEWHATNWDDGVDGHQEHTTYEHTSGSRVHVERWGGEDQSHRYVVSYHLKGGFSAVRTVGVEAAQLDRATAYDTALEVMADRSGE